MNANPVALSLTRIYKSFRTSFFCKTTQVLHDISMKVLNNQTLGVFGPNGSGKTTLLKITLGLTKPTHGEILIHGLPPSHKTRLRTSVGYMPERTQLYPLMTGRALLAFYAGLHGFQPKKRDERIAHILSLLDIKEISNRQIKHYSKGQLQRLTFAQALIHDPEILVLDEPLTGIDPAGINLIVDLLFKLKQEGKTLLICSHFLPQMALLCDRIAILDRGRLLVEGLTQELLMNKSLETLYLETLTNK